MTATASGWESPEAAESCRGPLEDVRHELEEIRDYAVRAAVDHTLSNTLAGDRLRRARDAVELAYQEVGLALDTI
jgi:hypothetical protein